MTKKIALKTHSVSSKSLGEEDPLSLSTQAKSCGNRWHKIVNNEKQMNGDVYSESH